MGRKRKKIIITVSVVLLFCILFSCKTPPAVDSSGESVSIYKVEDNPKLKDTTVPYRYIFFRFYNVDYKNPLDPACFLQKCVNSTEINDIMSSHVSIGFSLDDEFYGLTSGGRYQLAKEYCINNEANKYTRKCAPDTSYQMVFALKVTEDEYNNVKKMVEEYASGTDIHYDLLRVCKMASFTTKRRFFTEKDKQVFGNIEYPREDDAYKDDPDYVENNFVCSTFVAYVLEKNVSSIAKWFEENNIDYRYVNVSDVAKIPGVMPLFSSTFSEYGNAAQEFVDENPEFSDYYSGVDFQVE